MAVCFWITLSTPSENDVSVVLWVRVGNISLLFGSDLEEGADEQTGWSAIVADPPMGRAIVFKVAHHGADNGHHDGIWTNLLMPNPIALPTPFARGRKKRPSPEDVGRLKGLTSSVLSTARVQQSRSRTRRDPAVQRTLTQFGYRLRKINSSFGAIRLRSKFQGTSCFWGVEMFGDALQAEYLYQLA